MFISIIDSFQSPPSLIDRELEEQSNRSPNGYQSYDKISFNDQYAPTYENLIQGPSPSSMNYEDLNENLVHSESKNIPMPV